MAPTLTPAQHRLAAALQAAGLFGVFEHGTDEHTGKRPGTASLKRLGLQGTHSHDTIAKLRRSLAQSPALGAPYRDGEPAQPEAPAAGQGGGDPADAYAVRGDTATASGIAYGKRPTAAEIMARWEIDPTTWEPDRLAVKEWTSHMKIKRRNIVATNNGEQLVRLEDVPQENQAWHYSLSFRRIKGSGALKALAADLLADLGAAAPAPPRRKARRRREGDLVTLHAPDVHAGKVPTSGRYDGPAAFRAAAYHLMERVAHRPVGSFLVPVGSDALNVDGSRRGTTRGTPQDGGDRWREHFRGMVAAYREVIERASEVAPVRVVTIGGNHDRDACFYMGEVLGSIYDGHPHVAVTNDDHPRVYVQHGRCLLGITHGDGVKLADLPRLMSEEAPDLWAQADACREWLTGHLHGLRVQSIGSCVVRISDALCPDDAWHRSKGYVGKRRAAEALVYDAEHGRVATEVVPYAALA